MTKIKLPPQSGHVRVPNDGVSTHVVNLEQTINHLWSAASLNGFALTDNLDGTVDIAAGDVLLRPTDVHDSQLKVYYIAETIGVALTDNDQNFIYAQYNGGSPNLAVTTDPTTIDGRTETPLWSVTRVGNNIHYVDIRFYTTDYIHEQTRKEFFTQGYIHEPGGSIIADEGSRTFSVSAGAFYLTDKRIPHIGIDTSGVGTFTRYYTADNGVTWTRTTGQTAIDNTQYNDPSTGLVALGTNKYKVVWVFMVLNSTDFLAVVEGQAEYVNQQAAEVAVRPNILPPEVEQYSTGVLVGRVLLQEGNAEIVNVETPFGDFLLASSPTVIVQTLAGLTDTDIVAPSNGDHLVYNNGSGNWENTPADTTNYADTLAGVDWILDAGDIYYGVISHNLATVDVHVTVFDSVTNEEVLVEKIDRIDANTVWVYIQGNTASLRVLVSTGGVGYSSVAKSTVTDPTTPHTLEDRQVIIWDCSGGNKIANLPAAATSTNMVVYIKKTDASAFTITVTPAGIDTIDGAASVVLNTQWETYTLISNGTNWFII